jgi:hypothetical protein
MFKHGKHMQPGHKDYGMKPKPHAGGPESHPQEGQHPMGHAANAHEHGTPKHVEETHPGETQPHPTTGVHAFHAHHTGGGHYTSHTHHGGGGGGGGEVETRDHGSHADMLSAMHEAFPAENEADEEREGPADGTEYAEELAEGIGGTKVA